MSARRRTELSRPATPEDLAFARNLQSSRRLRDRRQLFFAEGVRNFLAILDNRWDVDTVLYSERLLTAGIARSKVRALVRQGIQAVRLSPEDFRIISTAHRASGVAALVRHRVDAIGQLNPKQGQSWFVVHSSQSMGNLGTLLRTSTAVGGAGMIVVGSDVDPFCPTLVRASMGCLFNQQLVQTGIGALEKWIARHRVQAVGATPEASLRYTDFAFQTPAVIALGHERHGLSSELRNLCTDFVRIPMTDKLDSLNLSVAGSLLMYEIHRCGQLNQEQSV